MPVSAELMPYLYTGKWQIYDRIGWSIVLPADEIVFYWLSDWIHIPAVGKAYSPGDFLTLGGSLWFLGDIVEIPNSQTKLMTTETDE